MKKYAFVLLTGLLLAPNALSFTIVKDIDKFYSTFGNPNVTIDFMELKDGTSIDKISAGYEVETSLILGSKSCMNSDENTDDSILFPLTVGSRAFSDYWSFRGAHPTMPGLFCEVIIWFDQGITTGKYNVAVSVPSGYSEPFVLYTNKGFIGIIPDSQNETDFIFDNFNKVFVFETRFSKTARKQEPIKFFDQNPVLFARPHQSKRLQDNSAWMEWELVNVDSIYR